MYVSLIFLSFIILILLIIIFFLSFFLISMLPLGQMQRYLDISSRSCRRFSFVCLLGIAFRELARHDCQREFVAALEFDFHGGLQVIDIPDGNAAHGLPRLDLNGLRVSEISLVIVQSTELQSFAVLRCRQQIDR